MSAPRPPHHRTPPHPVGSVWPLRSGAAVGEDGGAWSQPYYHAPAPWATTAKYAKGCHCPEGGECAVGATNCSCGNGSILDDDCDGGPVHPRTASYYSNATSNGLGMPDGTGPLI